MNVNVEPALGYYVHVATARFFGVLRLGVGKVDVCLQKHSAKQTTSLSEPLWEK